MGKSLGEANTEDIDKSLNEMLNAQNDKDYMLTNLKAMIKYQNDLADQVESRRMQVNQFALQTLALSFTGIGVVVALANGDYSLVVQGVLAFLFVYALTALATTIVFERQSAFKYPFLDLKKGGNSWRWFYYGNPFVQKLRQKFNIYV